MDKADIRHFAGAVLFNGRKSATVKQTPAGKEKPAGLIGIGV
jgi:hypothetical protein